MFFFTNFECSILLEEMEFFLGIDCSKMGHSESIFVPPLVCSSLSVLQEFVTISEALSLLEGERISLPRLLHWTLSYLESTGDLEEQSVSGLKGALIYIVVIVLYPLGGNVISASQLAHVTSVW